MARPKIKICGVTTLRDALASADLGADLVGLNFYRESPRFLELETAREISLALRQQAPQVKVVGVFVNARADTVYETDRFVGLDLLQFHGDEAPADISHCAARAIRALRLDGEELSAAALAPWRDCWAVLLDAPHQRLYGGTGEAWEFARAARLTEGRRLLLAGGLTSGNVAGALRAVPGAWGLDVCSGVEASAGEKDPAELARFFSAIEEASAARRPRRTADRSLERETSAN